MNTRITAVLLGGFCVLLFYSLLWDLHPSTKAQESGSVSLAQSGSVQSVKEERAQREHEVSCLTQIILREARGEPVWERIRVAMVFKARQADPDPQWAKSICGQTQQKGQVSQFDKPKHFSDEEWDENHAIAEYIEENAWITLFLPEGWECVRYYKISDDILRHLSRRAKRQYGIKSGKGIAYFHSLEAVEKGSEHTYYKDPRRCMKQLPTVASLQGPH
jgi:hypothetical protein